MDTPIWHIRRLDTPTDDEIESLTDVLVDCVQGGASVGFMVPLDRGRAFAFWKKVASAVALGDRVLLVAEDELGVCGTVQLIVDLPDNQPHRADVAKMLVHRRARRRGLGEALMKAVQSEAKQRGKTLLVLDTVTDSEASRLYGRLGWVRVGDIPGFALFPSGEVCSTTYFYRDLTQ